MILTNKNAPLSIGADAGAVKITQDDCITISTEEYSNYVKDALKLDMIAAVLASDYIGDPERMDMIRIMFNME